MLLLKSELLENTCKVGIINTTQEDLRFESEIKITITM